MAARPGWAKQDPQNWWENLKLSTQAVMAGSGIGPDGIAAIGISYQMHGLVDVYKRQTQYGCKYNHACIGGGGGQWKQGRVHDF